MDEKNLKDSKKQSTIDNSHLEELIKQDITPEMQREVFEVLKKSRLYLPVDFGPDAFKGIEDLKPGDKIDGPDGFDIQFLTDNNGNKAVPLFTSEEMMKKAGVRTSVMVIYMGDLADMLKQTDMYSIISINPFTEYDLNMPIEAFLANFEKNVPHMDNSRLMELLKNNEFSDEEFDEFRKVVYSSILIVGCVEDGGETNFVLIWDDDNKPHLPLFTDLEEFQKIFRDYDDVFPAAYYFTDIVSVAKKDIVFNPASESRVFNPEMFKK